MSTWECVSCGAAGQEKPYCEACGAAQPMDGVDTALSLVIGRVCTSCDAYNDPGEAVCTSCGAALGDEVPAVTEPQIDTAALSTPPSAAAPAAAATEAPTAGAPPQWMQAPSGQPLATAFSQPKVDLAELKRSGVGMAAPASTPQPIAAQASSSTSGTAPSERVHAPAAASCAKCGLALETNDKFCRSCGTRVGDAPAPTVARLAGLPSPVLGTSAGATSMMPAFRSVGIEGVGPGAPTPPSMTMVFGAVTAERSAKLVLVRGQSSFGTQWRLQAGESALGRSVGAVLFPDDAALSAEHARFRFVGGELMLVPLPSNNGVFVRIKEPVRLAADDEFVLGAERLVVLGDAERPASGVLSQADTRALGSLTKPQPPITLLRVSSDPTGHEVYCRCQRVLTLGRNHCDLNFPRDSFVSERHAQLSRHDDGTLVLEDLRSRNGTYLRATQPLRLSHGDLILLTDKVLRVELPQR